MRGTHVIRFKGSPAEGIIPADAGNTPCVYLIFVIRKDHPRGCGEHTVFLDDKGQGWGSSPRMRGTRRARRPVSAMSGIIPADAGNTHPKGSWL